MLTGKRLGIGARKITMVTRKRAFVVVVSPETEAAALFTAIEDEDDDIESNLFNDSCW